MERRKTRNVPEVQRNISILSWERDHVRASVIQLGEGVAELIGVAAAPMQGIGRTAHPDIDRWFAGCSAALTEAEDMTEAASGHKVVPNYLAMGIPAEIVTGLPVTIKRPRHAKQEGITQEELEQALRKSYRSAQDILAAGTTPAALRDGQEIISGSLVEITVDGQVVDDPVGLQGETLELSVYYCLAPREWVRALQIVADRLETGLTVLVPHQMALALPLPHPVALLIVLDEHHTVVSGVRRGQVEWTSLVDMGERQMVEATAAALSLRERQANALMRVYRARQLHEEAEIQVAAAFWAQLRQWMDQLGDAARPHVQDGAVPRQVFFVDDTRHMPEALQSLQTPYWEQRLPFGCCPDVVEFSLTLVRNVLDCTARAGGAEFLKLRALAHYMARLYAADISLERTLAQMIRLR